MPEQFPPNPEDRDYRSPYHRDPGEDGPQQQPPQGDEEFFPACEYPDRYGAVGGFFKTIPQVLIRPSTLFARMSPTGPLLRPLFFAVVLGTFFSCVLIAIAGLYSGPGFGEVLDLYEQMGVDMSPLRPFYEALDNLGTAGMVGLALIFYPFLIPLRMVLTAGLTHVALRVFGMARRPFESTFRIVCYSYGGTMILNMLLVPCLAPLTQLTWEMACVLIGLSKQNGITFWKAFLVFNIALAAGAVLLCCVCCVPVVLLVFFAAG